MFLTQKHQYTCFFEKGHAKNQKKGPCQARGGHRRPSLFLRKINKSVFESINLTFYHTQIDASDHIYPMGALKPHFLLKNQFFIGNGSKNQKIKNIIFWIPPLSGEVI